MSVVPFTIPQLYAGFASARGLLRDDQSHLTFEFQVQEEFFEIKGPARSVTLPVSQLAAVRYVRGWFSDQLLIQAKTLVDIADLPGSKAGLAVLSVAKKYRGAGEAFVERLHEPVL